MIDWREKSGSRNKANKVDNDILLRACRNYDGEKKAVCKRNISLAYREQYRKRQQSRK